MDAFSTSNLFTMVRSLHKMHQVGIWIRDPRSNEYHGGCLLDVSRAWTMPHPYLKRESINDERKTLPEEYLTMDAY